MRQAGILREFTKYAALNVLGMLGLSFYILADTFFISLGLGANGLTALNLALPVYSCIHGCGLMLGMGGATRYTILKSREETEGAKKIFTQTLLLALGFMLVFVLTGIFASDQLALALGADSAVFEMTKTYLKVILLFSPAFLLNQILLCFVRNHGNPRLSMFAMLGGSLSNVVLDYLFIFPMDMGIFGAVLATGFAPLISMMILSPYLLRQRAVFTPVKAGITLKHSLRTLSSGLPSLIAEISSGIVILVFNSILLRLQGNTGVAAYGVIANLSLVVLSVYTGISQGMQPLLSRNYGAGLRDNVKRISRYGRVTVLGASLIFYTLIFFFADPITGIFNSENNPQLQELAVWGMRIYFTGIFFAGFNLTESAGFAAVEQAFPAQAISLLRGFLLILPLSFLLSALFQTTGVWLAFPAAELLTSLAALFLHLRKPKPLR